MDNHFHFKEQIVTTEEIYIRPYFQNVQNQQNKQSGSGVATIPISCTLPILYPQYNSHPILLANVPINITTLSNTRIDFPRNETKDTNQVTNEDENITFENNSQLQSYQMLSTSTAKDDFEFSYDYETYMYQVTNNSGDKLKTEPVPAHEYIPFGNNPDRNISHSTFGLELLDLSESIVINKCQNLPLAIRNSFEKNGTLLLTGSPYEVTSKTGSPIFFMTETTNCLGRFLSCGILGLTGLFTATVVDVCGTPSLNLSNAEKGFSLSCCYRRCADLCCCCTSLSSRKFKVTYADGESLGRIRQTRRNSCNPGFVLKDSKTKIKIRSNGPKFSICEKLSLLTGICCCFSCLIDDDIFYFIGRKGKRIAEVKKSTIEIPFGHSEATLMAAVTLKSILPDYCITIDFAEGLNINSKALVLAVSFIIDKLYWQSPGD